MKLCAESNMPHLEEYIRQHVRGETVVLVGNAPFQRDCSAMIDAHAHVVRFNDFEQNGFTDGLCGTRMTHWCVNLGTGRTSRTSRKRQDELCHKARVINPDVIVLTPYHNDKHNRLPDVAKYYPDRGLLLSFPKATLGHPLALREPLHPSVGFYMAYHLLIQEICVTIIGFTGKTSRFHDGHQELQFLREHALVRFFPMDS